MFFTYLILHFHPYFPPNISPSHNAHAGAPLNGGVPSSPQMGGRHFPTPIQGQAQSMYSYLHTNMWWEYYFHLTFIICLSNPYLILSWLSNTDTHTHKHKHTLTHTQTNLPSLSQTQALNWCRPRPWPPCLWWAPWTWEWSIRYAITSSVLRLVSTSYHQWSSTW